MIERLMSTEMYTRDPVTKMYDTDVLSKLVKNFRSHPEIIKMSNEMFYDGDLIACAPSAVAYAYVNWRDLPVKGIPIIFESVIGFATKEHNSER